MWLKLVKLAQWLKVNCLPGSGQTTTESSNEKGITRIYLAPRMPAGQDQEEAEERL